jgi:hypothetical protein
VAGCVAGSESVDETDQEDGMVPEDALIQLVVGVGAYAATAERKPHVAETTVELGQETQQEFVAEAQAGGLYGEGQSAEAAALREAMARSITPRSRRFI